MISPGIFADNSRISEVFSWNYPWDIPKIFLKRPEIIKGMKLLILQDGRATGDCDGKNGMGTKPGNKLIGYSFSRDRKIRIFLSGLHLKWYYPA